MIIGDIATGTGRWPLELAETLPRSTKIEGLDKNLDQIPFDRLLPPNVTFKEFDLMRDVPHDLVERYDVINIQYVMIFVLDHNFNSILGKVQKMLSKLGIHGTLSVAIDM